MSTNKRPRVNMAVVVLLAIVGVLVSGWAVIDQAWLYAAGALVLFLGAAIALLVFSRRSDVVSLLGDDVHEERNVHIHRHAAIITLNIVAAVIVIAGVVDVFRGGDGAPYSWLAAVLGITYIVSLLVINRRS